LWSALAGWLASFNPLEAQLRKGLFQQDLPNFRLEGWDFEAVELTFPAGYVSSPHHHSGFVIGYVLEGEFRFQIEGEPEVVYKQGQMFYEPPGAHHLVASSANPMQTTRVLAILFGERGKPKTLDL
jgi:quercetin dioxygenase-like cupin family protein